MAKLNFKSHFPDKNDVLNNSFSHYDNFFPLATIEIKSLFHKKTVPLIYTFLDPENNQKAFKLSQDNVDDFGFDISKEGIVTPQFEDSTLFITDLFKDTFTRFKQRCHDIRNENLNISSLIDFSDEPDWMQWDQTPMNRTGRKMEFICQVDIYELGIDSCREYFFIDSNDSTIRSIYQRT